MNTNTNTNAPPAEVFDRLLTQKINEVVTCYLPVSWPVCTIQCLTAGSTQSDAEVWGYNHCAPALIRATMGPLPDKKIVLVTQGDKQIPKVSEACPEPRASGVAAATAQFAGSLQDDGHQIQILGVSDQSNEKLQAIYPGLPLAAEPSDHIRKTMEDLVDLLKGPDGAAMLRQYYPKIDLYIAERQKQGKDANLHYFLQQLFAAKLAEATGGYQIVIDPNQSLLRVDKHISAHCLETCPTIRVSLPDMPPQ